VEPPGIRPPAILGGSVPDPANLSLEQKFLNAFSAPTSWCEKLAQNTLLEYCFRMLLLR